jgi:CHAT domain-containing protein/tetratricopeptide (TPR) repeat protein
MRGILPIVGLLGLGLAGCGGSRTAAANGGLDTTVESAAGEAEEHGDLARARDLRERLVSEYAQDFGRQSAQEAAALHEAARIYGLLGDYERAENVFRSALTIEEKLGGAQSSEVAKSSRELARVCLEAGDFPQASDALTRAIRITTGRSGWKSVETALSNLLMGDFVRRTGDCDAAELFYKDAQATLEAAGAENYLVSEALEGRANCLANASQYAEAETLFQHALTIREHTKGIQSLEVAMTLNDLGKMYGKSGNAARAEATLTRAAEMTEKTRGSDHPAFAAVLQNVGEFYLDSKPDRAERMLQRALQIQSRTRPMENPAVASALRALVYLYWKRGTAEQALEALNRELEVEENCISNAINAEPRAPLGVRVNYLLGLSYEKDWVISFQAQHPSEQGRRLALVTLLRRKGRELDVMGNTVRVLRSRATPGIAAAAQKALAVKRGDAKRAFENLLSPASSSGDQSIPVEASGSFESLESAIVGVPEGDMAGLAKAYREASPLTTLESVAKKIPAGEALVEFAEYVPVDPAVGAGSPRYAAFVLREGADVSYLDLGDAASIDSDVTKFRAALGDPRSNPVPLARSLDERLTRPLRAVLGGSRHVTLAPDSHLSQLPFGALIDEHHDYLVKHWSFTYLTSGRELVQLAGNMDEPRSASMVIADPDFGTSAAEPARLSRGLAVSDLSRVVFPQLPGTAAEGRAIASSLNAQLVTGSAASRETLAGVHGPRVLHIATHGFFLQDTQRAVASSRGLSLDLNRASATDLWDIDALQRAGIVLAGANAHSPNDSGIISASEALWLDLAGTELVVLSACETALGEISAGQGVRGLQQALVVAGARSLVMSLWKVDDDATRALMASFYRSLGHASTRADSLRAAQLELIATTPFSHPYYWAAFIQYGDGSALPQR